MEISSLPYSLDITSTTGATLSTEELYVVQNSLRLLQHDNHFSKTYFLGKIFGIEKDYYIAFGCPENGVEKRIFHFSTNQRDWFPLNNPTFRAIQFSRKLCEHFQGDPNHVLDCKLHISLVSGDSDSADLNEGAEHHLKEEERLAAVIKAMFDECAIAPKGSFLTSCFEVNPVFQGLDLGEGCNIKSWMHIKQQDDQKWQLLKKREIAGGDSEQGLKGQWSARVRAQGSVCVWRSLSWLGLTAYHRLRTPDHGFVYFGYGIKASHMFGLDADDYSNQRVAIVDEGIEDTITIYS